MIWIEGTAAARALPTPQPRFSGPRAIAMLASVCLHCGCRVIGHRVEASGDTYGCAHCARAMGKGGL